VGEQTAEVIVRPAQPEDREAVLAFCQHTWDGGDYIEDVWEDWLTAESGALLVAVSEGQPVGLVHLAMLSHEDAWLEGIRVDPRVQRQGIGRVLTSQALVVAREHGATVARLFTSSENVASQELMTKKFGFQRVAEVAQYTGRALQSGSDPDADALLETDESEALGIRQEPAVEPPPGPRLLLAGSEDYTRLWEWLKQSNLAATNGGLQFGWWSAWTLHDTDLQDYLVHGAAWLLEEWDVIQAVALVRDEVGDEDSPATLQVRYIDGAAGGISTLALVLREIAQEHDLEQVVMWLPDLLILQDAMNGAGYTRGSHEKMWVYQRSL
jgi:ribosomal protein S18 acetylase RimI-like enzyme